MPTTIGVHGHASAPAQCPSSGKRQQKMTWEEFAYGFCGIFQYAQRTSGGI
jgi:hypothetical protein